jgi:hypothetical protein
VAKPFDPRKVLRQASNALLQQLFDRVAGGLPGLDWDAVDEADAEPVFAAWQALPADRRLAAQVALQEAHELAEPRGLALMAGEVGWRAAHRLAEFAALESRVDKAVWTLVTVPEAFEEAARYGRVDALAAGRFWHRRTGLPTRDGFTVTPATTDALAAALAAFYPAEQGRGHWCHVDHYARRGGAEYFFAYLADYPDTHVLFEGGALRRRAEHGAFDVVFVYGPADGTLEMYALGGRPVLSRLERLFGEAVLGAAVDPAEPDRPAFHLDGLKDPAFAFATEPEDGVAGARLRRLRLQVIAAPGRRVTFEVGQKGERGELYDMVADYLDQTALPLSAVRATLATIQLTFAAAPGARPRTLTFDVGHPSSCNLKNQPDEVRAVAERCLKRWGVMP